MEDLKRFNEEEKQRIVKWLSDRKALGNGCLACHNKSLNLTDHFASMPSTGADGNTHLDKIFPCVAVKCVNCGYMMFFNAISMGLFRAPDAAAVAENPQELGGA